jgi:hypothetical protein
MAQLKAATRNQLPSSAFGLPQALLRDESSGRPIDIRPVTPLNQSGSTVTSTFVALAQR